MTEGFDIAIIGAGPVGLALARSLAGSGLRLALIDRQPQAALEAPAFDGREIALTRQSVEHLRALGAWSRLGADEIAPLERARVINGRSPFALDFTPPVRDGQPLGHLVANQAIRRTLFAAATDQEDLALFVGSAVERVTVDADGAALRFSDGRRLRARLLVAADARLSETRRQLGIGAAVTDFGRVMLVCRMAHERPHQAVATEAFGHGQTVATLPLNSGLSSVVLTVQPAEADTLMTLDPARFAVAVANRLDHRFGAMRLESSRHRYPLIAVYADHFAGTRLALAGDAAVGMHPVTAHGFNLGLAGQARLATELLTSLRRGADIGGPAPLQRYATAFRRQTWPIFTATNAIVRLYTDDRPAAQPLRHLGLRLAQHLPLFRQGVVTRLLRV